MHNQRGMQRRAQAFICCYLVPCLSILYTLALPAHGAWHESMARYICPVIELECFAMVLLYPNPPLSMHARLMRVMKPHNTLHTLHHCQTYIPSYFFEPIF